MGTGVDKSEYDGEGGTACVTLSVVVVVGVGVRVCVGVGGCADLRAGRGGQGKEGGAKGGCGKQSTGNVRRRGGLSWKCAVKEREIPLVRISRMQDGGCC